MLFSPDWRTLAPAHPPEPGTVHVWRADLDAQHARREQLTKSLATDELGRVSRFHFERDRFRYSIRRGILRLLIGRYLGRHPAAVSFTYTARARPYLSGPETLVFNLSHSHGMALYAFAHDCEIGIDLERYDPELPAEDIARRFFTPEEAAFVLEGPPADRNERFSFLWSRKEAYTKARGEGLYLPLNEFDLVSRSTLNGFDIQSFSAFPQFAAALAMKPRPSEILFFDLDLADLP